MKVKFTPNDEQRNQYMDLTPNNVYRVILLTNDEVVVMSDEGAPYSFPLDMFTVIDTQWPEDWIEITNDGEYRVTSKLFAEPDFFERVFDGDKKARMTLRKRLQYWRSGKD